MDEFLSFSDERRKIVCEEAQQRLGLVAASIEKDFWVCWTLRELFGLPVWGELLTFKGGTSLSKGWGLISRFSEDIDVVINRDYLGFSGETLSNNRLNKLQEACGKRIQGELRPALESRMSEVLSGSLGWSLVPADDDNQTLLFQYPSVFTGSITYLRPVVKIELGARSETEPVESPFIKPYLADAFPDMLSDCSFSINTVAARRTFWEKAMLLHEETFRPSEKPRRARLSRHYYDLWCLIGKGIAAEAVADTDLFEHVARHRQIFFKQNWVDYGTLRKGTLRLIPPPEQMSAWRQDYDAMREEMFFDEPPKFDEVLTAVAAFESEFNAI